MVFRQRMLQLEPCLEDIRAKHYRENLAAFLNVPAMIRGFSASTEAKGSLFFRSILEDNAREIARCYSLAEGSLFMQLKKSVDTLSTCRQTSLAA